MLKNQLKKLTVAALVAAMIVPAGVSNAGSEQVTRISGKDRIQTSVEISKSAYTTSENVVLASGFNFADALSAGQLASALNAPLLLSSQNKLDSQTKNEIERLKAKKVYVVGGDNAISKNGVDTTLKSENINVTRLEGQDRYSTSQKVMEKTKEIINPEYLLIASGKNFPDALAATSFFVNHKSVMVLSDGVTYPQSNLQEIAIGGVNQLPLKGFKGKRVSGKDRYETALKIAKISFDKNNNAILASGQVFADSLSAVSLTKKHNAPIVLTQSNYLTENAKKYLNGKNVLIVGGEKTVVNDILTSGKPIRKDLEKEFEERNKEVDEELIKREKEFQEKWDKEKEEFKKGFNEHGEYHEDIDAELDKIENERQLKTEELNKRQAKNELDEVARSLSFSRENLKELQDRLQRYQNPDKNEKTIEDEIKYIQRDIEEFEKRNKKIKDYHENKIEEIDKELALVDTRVNEGAFAFFEWAGEKYPDYKMDADRALDILNEYYKKGDVKKTPGDATSYENLMASADLYKQLKDFIYKANVVYSTNFSTLAKAMVSCNRNVYSSNKNTFNVTEYLYNGQGNPIEYWYYDGKAVYDEVVKIINEKYANEYSQDAMVKAKEDYKRIHGKEADFGYFGDVIEYTVGIAAIARNTSNTGLNNTFCLNGGKMNSFVTRIWNFDEIIRGYKDVTNKDDLLNEKAKSQKELNDLEQYRKNRKAEIDRLKKEKNDRLARLKDETARLKEEIKEIEKEIARLEKEYKEKKEAYDKLK
ncbi:MAG: cell wall-binding repeat-containing protein [Finegoldia magna]|uniref:cell wall-binding repeat-containing protein n=1 Tax=Finegoldia magna TaxID=1260 RepID=UPI0026EB4C94|nr:cell wall-binding repeat-containing protein [Finegoldia magna]MBS5776740.1 cell wall-binding repeat-containing protein [Finegoldia magna]